MVKIGPVIYEEKTLTDDATGAFGFKLYDTIYGIIHFGPKTD